MSRSLLPRKTVDLPESLHRRLSMYSLAASAAGAGTLALSCPAEAKIVYTPAHIVLGGEYYQYKLDLNHDGVTDLTISNSYSNDIVRWFSSVLACPANGSASHSLRLTRRRSFAILSKRLARSP
jgi:hypothetical protein